MRDFSTWSINLGRWRGVHVRLHAFFLLFAVFTLFLSSRQNEQIVVQYASGALIVLLLSVAAHELGHALVAFRVGGHVDEVVLGPLGGLAQARVPRDPQHELVVALAGPAVNLLICLAMAPIIVAAAEPLVGLLKPLEPEAILVGPPWLVAVKLTLWINWVLLLTNVFLPASPFDGGRILRAVLWHLFDYRTAVASVMVLARVVAGMLCLAAVLSRNQVDSGLVPLWVTLILLAILVFFSAKQETARIEEQEIDEELFSYDFSQGYTSLERHLDSPHRSASPLRRWVEGRREARRRRRQLLEQDEERRVDEILVRLHQHGMRGITPKERALLDRVSARYRNRQQS